MKLLCDASRIAVEVRRLNQNVTTEDSYVGLEDVSTRLHSIISKALVAAGPPLQSHSWFVFVTFRRPLPPWKTLEALLREQLRAFRECPWPASVSVVPELELEFAPASTLHREMFVLVGSSDDDSGGFVLTELARNLRLCINKKLDMTLPFMHRYAEWWLAFEDRIAYGAIDERDAVQLRELVPRPPEFSKVLLVSPLDAIRAVELWRGRFEPRANPLSELALAERAVGERNHRLNDFDV